MLQVPPPSYLSQYSLSSPLKSNPSNMGTTDLVSQKYTKNRVSYQILHSTKIQNQFVMSNIQSTHSRQVPAKSKTNTPLTKTNSNSRSNTTNLTQPTPKTNLTELNNLKQVFTTKISELEIKSGKYQGAFLSGPNGYINWYFNNITLLQLVDTEPAKVKRYLNLYLANLESDYTIRDINNDLSGTLFPDSHDSYSATYLHLVSAYIQKTNDFVWLRANLPKLKLIAKHNLLDQQKPNGLIYTFQGGKPHNLSYLMDNSEIYAGLGRFSDLLRNIRDPEANKYRIAVSKIAEGIHTQLYDNRNQNWLVSDQSDPAKPVFYPDLTAQIFPELYNVISRTSIVRFDRAYNFFIKNTPNWSKMDNDVFPWTILAYYHAQTRRDTVGATYMLTTFANNLSNPSTRYSIIDLGWAVGATNLLIARK